MPPDLMAAAQKEGQLTMVWSIFTGNGPKLSDGFKKYYNLPSSFNVTFTAGPPNMPTVAQQLSQEVQANKASSTDIFLADANSILTLQKAGGTKPADWKWASNIKPDFVALDGAAVEVSTRVNGVTYNTDTIKNPPLSLQDLLKPEFKGKLATTPYFAGWSQLVAKEFLGDLNTTLDYTTKVSQQLGGLMGCGEEARVASGEFPLFGLDCGAAGERPVAAKGGHVSHQILKDWGAYQHIFLAIPKNGAHPNAAMLMTNYLLTREAQDLIWQSDFTDLAELPGSHEKPAIDQETPAGTKFVTIDFAFIQENQAAIDQATPQVQGILRKATSK
ncbi:MAG: extracellular solute-binding protein [Chloroflexi bacterium]|nr:extracellular solute-binding protein [Chloroflexota bacterium]